jgi:hypothetical protein
MTDRLIRGLFVHPAAMLGRRRLGTSIHPSTTPAIDDKFAIDDVPAAKPSVIWLAPMSRIKDADNRLLVSLSC